MVRLSPSTEPNTCVFWPVKLHTLPHHCTGVFSSAAVKRLNSKATDTEIDVATILHLKHAPARSMFEEIFAQFEEIFAGIEKYSLIEIYYLHTAQSLLVIGLVSVSMSNSMAAVEAIATEKPKLGQTTR